MVNKNNDDCLQLFIRDLMKVFDENGVKGMRLPSGDYVGYNQQGDFLFKGVNVILDKPDWYVKEMINTRNNSRFNY